MLPRNAVLQCLPSLALFAWALIAIVPFASRVHYVPLPQYFGEINVVWLTALAGACLLLAGQGLRQLPAAAVWMLGLAAYWQAQVWLVPLVFPGLNSATALAFVALAVLALVTAQLKLYFGISKVLTALAWALVAGAIVQSLIGFCQLTGLAQVMGGVLFYDHSHPTTNVFGHIGQRNQYAHYLMWGLLCGVYLHVTGQMSRKWLIVLTLWLSAMLAWAGSRTVLLYLVAEVALAGIWYWQARTYTVRRMLGVVTAVAGCVLLFQLLLPLFNQLLSWLMASQVTGASGIERLASNSDGMGSRRLGEMHKAWLVFRDAPWFGSGWSQFAVQSVRLQTLPAFAAAGYNSGLFTHCHNLILQLLAETGLVGTLLAVGGFFLLLIPFFRQPATVETLLPVMALSVSFIHSLLEYPLWYLYFLAVCVIWLTLAPGRVLRLPRAGSLATGAALLLVGVLSVMTMPRYWELVDLYTPTGNPGRDAGRVNRLEAIVRDEPMFAFHALNTLDNYLPPTREHLSEKRHWITLLAAFRPYPDVMLKKAQLEALAGEGRLAEATLRTSLASFPTYAGDYYNALPESEPAYEGLRVVASEVYDRLPAQYR